MFPQSSKIRQLWNSPCSSNVSISPPNTQLIPNIVPLQDDNETVPTGNAELVENSRVEGNENQFSEASSGSDVFTSFGFDSCYSTTIANNPMASPDLRPKAPHQIDNSIVDNFSNLRISGNSAIETPPPINSNSNSPWGSSMYSSRPIYPATSSRNYKYIDGGSGGGGESSNSSFSDETSPSSIFRNSCTRSIQTHSSNSSLAVFHNSSDSDSSNTSPQQLKNNNLDPHQSTNNSYERISLTLNFLASVITEESNSLSNNAFTTLWKENNWNKNSEQAGPPSPNRLFQILRKAQDELISSNDLEMTAFQRSQLCDIACNLQKQLMQRAMGIDSVSPNVCQSDVFLDSNSSTNKSIEQAQKFLREHSNLIQSNSIVWQGYLPKRSYINGGFSTKVFIGGLAYDMTEAGLIASFKTFGDVKVEWPGKEYNPNQHKGYAYVIFENEKQVNNLLQNCILVKEGERRRWYCKLSSRKVRNKDVEVIPWALGDSNFSKHQNPKIDPNLTVFVGALHGTGSAEDLAIVFEDLFGPVVHAGLDTDRCKYPIGSGRLTFNNYTSYFKAITAEYVDINSSKFKKTVQVDPYIIDATCAVCNLQQAPYFCRDLNCFRYFCRTCYEQFHNSESSLRSHRPFTRSPNKKCVEVDYSNSSSPSFEKRRNCETPPGEFSSNNYSPITNFSQNNHNSNWQAKLINGNMKFFSQPDFFSADMK